MLNTTEDLQPARERTSIRVEKQLLIGNYEGMLMRRFMDSYGQCENPEEAYFLYLEQTYKEVPEDLRFEALQRFIPEEHIQRISGIYQFMLTQRSAYLESLNALTSHWRWWNVPVYFDSKAGQIMKESPIKVQRKYNRALKAVISTSDRTKKWRLKEKTFRSAYEETQKRYLTSLRLYYEMLLEQSHDKNQNILSKNNPIRQKIAEHNRALRLLESAYVGIGKAKKFHHQQEGGRMRETEENVAYIKHPVEVSGATNLDVVPFIINELRMQINIALLGGIMAPTHDTLEDTGLSVEEIIKSLKMALDRYDNVRPAIKSGFNRSSEDIENEVLDLLKPNDIKILKQVIKILSKNYKLKDEEKIRGIKANTAGPELTRKFLGVWGRDAENWDVAEVKTPAETFQLTVGITAEEEKMAQFLVRMNAITSSQRIQQYALIIKCEDQAHNLSKMNGWTQEKKLKVLGRNMLLVRWAMLDHDNKKYPLYNALPRLIKTMLIEYEKLVGESCFQFEDGSSITELRQYERQLEEKGQMHELKPEIQAIIAQQQEKHKNVIAPLYGTGFSPSVVTKPVDKVA